MTAPIRIELDNGNEGRTKFWGSAASRRKKYRMVLKSQYGFQQPFEFPIRLVVVRVLGKGQRLFDADSLGRGNWKEIQDTLVELGWFRDDDARYITQVDFKQDDSQRANGPSILLEIHRSIPDDDAATGS